MEEIQGHTEELTATAIYAANEYNQPTLIIFLIGEYVITIDTAAPGAARWNYLENCISDEAFIPCF